MRAETVFILIVAILIADFILERILSFLNYKSLGQAVPDELKGTYDEEKYAKQQKYEKENIRFSVISSVFSSILIFLMLFFDGFAFVDSFARSISADPVLSALIFFGILLITFDLINSPFEIYDIFVIEQKYGFNKTTPLTYFLDKIKGWLIGGIIGGIILSLIVIFIQKFPDTFWIFAWITITFFMIFFTMFYSSVIAPLFNKQTPLEEGELKSGITSFAQKTGFKLDNIYVIDGSKRTTKANAYFSGLFSKKRIVLFDTLIKELTPGQIIAVLAHEIGHYKKKHTLMMILFSVIQTGGLLFVLSLFIGNSVLSSALGAEAHSIHMAIIAFGILYVPISTITGIFLNMLSRKHEYEADNFASKYFSAEELSGALKKLAENNLSNLTPHPLYVFFHYSHPPIGERIRNLMNRL
ncbi:MAG TPA: M48 family metallopeptidase [Spirochaetota bacterium]|nr:M48 family metallopeptidase [Spirochaetota bacterium]HQE58927.1 M48 family metallopeptidase [Spirochaetota bacterium]